MTLEQCGVLEEIARSTARLRREVCSAQALLFAAEGVANHEIACGVGVSVVTVRSWRGRFGGEGVGVCRSGCAGQGSAGVVGS